jgi:copper oxidase (laccase) domain-containing protein
LRFDGWTANHDQLIAAGLKPTNVHVARLCTMTHLSHFYSYRAEGVGTGRLLGVIRRAG